MNVREKAKQLVTLLKDEERLREERIHALKTKEKMAQTSSGKNKKRLSARGTFGRGGRLEMLASPYIKNTQSAPRSLCRVGQVWRLAMAMLWKHF